MNKAQETALRCAYADLLGALQAFQQLDIHAHDWKAHELTLQELAEAFPFLDADDTLTEKLAHEAQHNPDTYPEPWQDRQARDVGVPRWGEI